MAEIQLMPSMRISSSGLDAERLRMEVASNNLANVNSTRDPNGKLYQRLHPVFSAVMDEMSSNPIDSLQGVRVEAVNEENREPISFYAPYHPQADQNGMVERANVTAIEEMMDLMTATRAYEANLSAVRQSRDMAEKTINLGRR